MHGKIMSLHNNLRFQLSKRKLVYIFLALILSLCTFWFFNYIESQNPKALSMIQLIATPERYHNRHIRVIGFLRLEFEGNVIFTSIESAQHRVVYNRIDLDISKEESLQKRDELDAKYVLVEGVFNATFRGYRHLSVGTIEKITRLEKWSDPDAPRGLYRE